MARQSIERHGTTVLQIPPRPRRLEVRLCVSDGRVPIGRTRALRLRESDLAALVDVAERLDARAC